MSTCSQTVSDVRPRRSPFCAPQVIGVPLIKLLIDTVASGQDMVGSSPDVPVALTSKWTVGGVVNQPQYMFVGVLRATFGHAKNVPPLWPPVTVGVIVGDELSTAR